MKPQAQITEAQPGYQIHIERDGEAETLSTHFAHYQDALDYILEQGWQLKREALSSPLHVETRFLKP